MPHSPVKKWQAATLFCRSFYGVNARDFGKNNLTKIVPASADKNIQLQKPLNSSSPALKCQTT
jgi:hypothetical protein